MKQSTMAISSMAASGLISGLCLLFEFWDTFTTRVPMIVWVCACTLVIAISFLRWLKFKAQPPMDQGLKARVKVVRLSEEGQKKWV